MSMNNQQGHFLLIILVYTLFNFYTYGMSVPETRFTLAGDLGSRCVPGAATELAAGGLTHEEVAKLSEAQYRKYIVEHDMRLDSERKELMDAKQLLEEHQDETYKMALESYARGKTLSAKAAQNKVDMGSERVKSEFIEDTAKKDEAVDNAYKELKQARATYAEARLKLEAAAKNLQNQGKDPSPLTEDLSQLDDEEYIMEAAKHNSNVEYYLKLWVNSRAWLYEAVAYAYRNTLPYLRRMPHLPPTHIEEFISEQATFSELFARERGSSIDRMTALTNARMILIRPLANQAGEIRIPVLRDAFAIVKRYQEVAKISKDSALINADRYWMSTGKISREGKRYKGLTMYSPYDSIMATLEKLKPKVGNWYKMLHGWWNQKHTPNDMKNLAIVPYQGAKSD